ncbi:kinetochore protein Spc25-like [Argonauta hians]
MDTSEFERDFNFQQEYDIFDKKLSQFLENFTTKTHENWMKLIIAAQNSHDTRITSSKENLRELETCLDQRQKESQKKCRILEERNNKLQEMKTYCSEVMSEAHDRINKKQALERDLKQVTDKINHEKELISKQENSLSGKRVEYEKAKTYFVDRLGLQFKKTQGDRIQMIFKYINPRKPNKLYVFFIKIEEDGKYTVSNCQPLVPNLSELVSELNATNNLSNFIVSIRKAFISYCN